MLRLLKLLIFSLLIVLNIKVVHSFVIMDPGKALGMDMMGRDGSGGKTSSSSPSDTQNDIEKAPLKFDDVVDKQGILEVYFPKKENTQPEMPSVNLDLSTKTTIKATIPVGYIVRVILPEKEHMSWQIGDQCDKWEQISSQRQKNFRLIDFKTIKSGSDVVYLDSFDISKNPPQPIASRIIRLKVTP